MNASSKDGIIVDLLTTINRMRALTDAESRLLERTIRRVDRIKGRQTRPWTVKEDLRLRVIMRKRVRQTIPERFRPCDDVRRLAEEIGRTPEAIQRRIHKLRKMDKGSGERSAVRG